jgi:hypothetical protein
MSIRLAFLLTQGALLVPASAFLIACKAPLRADHIFINGHIVTMSDSLPEAEAFAVGDGKIAAVGTTKEILCHEDRNSF